MAHIVALSGLIGSGKSVAAEHLVSKYGYRRVSFAGALKRAVAELFGWKYELLLGATPESRTWREQPDPYWSKVFDREITPRWALQFVGTELVREHLHARFWVAHTEKTIQDTMDRNQNVVIDDMRFSNENDMITRLGGYRVWVVRGQLQDMSPDLQTLASSNDPEAIHHAFLIYKAAMNAHASEVEWLKRGRLAYDEVLFNAGTIHHFLAKIDDVHKELANRQDLV